METLTNQIRMSISPNKLLNPSVAMVKQIKSSAFLRAQQEVNSSMRKAVETIRTSNNNSGMMLKIDNNRAECQIDSTKSQWDGSTLLKGNPLSLNSWVADLNRITCLMIKVRIHSVANRILSSSCLTEEVEIKERMTGLMKKEVITCQESSTNQLSMVDTTASTISIITISTDLSIQITHSARKTRAIVVTQAVITLEVEVKATISTITKVIVAIRTNLVVIMLQGAKAGRQALRITTRETTSSQTMEAVVAIIMILTMEIR